MDQLDPLMFSPDKHDCDLGHVILVLSYFLVVQPAFTVRKFISSDLLVKFFPLLGHPSVQDLFARLLSACDTSLNLCTRYRFKVLEYLRLSEFDKLLAQVVVQRKRLDQVSQSAFCTSDQFLRAKKKLGRT